MALYILFENKNTLLCIYFICLLFNLQMCQIILTDPVQFKLKWQDGKSNFYFRLRSTWNGYKYISFKLLQLPGLNKTTDLSSLSTYFGLTLPA